MTAPHPRRFWQGLALVTVMLLVRFSGLWWQHWELIDEEIYLEAFETAARGESPYTVDGYLYPPAFAEWGAWMIDSTGRVGAHMTMRLLSFLALLYIAAQTARWMRPFTDRVTMSHWLLIAFLLVLANGVSVYVATGNVSFVAGAFLLAGLEQLERRPRAAGVCLAASALLKPFAVPAVAVLGVAGLVAGRRAWLWAAGTAGLLGLLLSVRSPYLMEMLTAQPTDLSLARSTSFARVLGALGFELSSLGILIVLTLGLCVSAAILARRPDVIHLLCLLGVLTMPLVWSHSLVMMTPLLGAALVVAWGRRHDQRLEPVWVAIGVGAVLFCQSGSVDRLPGFLEAIFLLPPLIAPIGLVVYLGRVGPGARRHVSRSGLPPGAAQDLVGGSGRYGAEAEAALLAETSFEKGVGDHG